MNVYQKLNNARLALQSLKLSKSGHNKFAGYTYFELGDFLPTIQTIFNDVGLCGTIQFGADLATLTVVNVDKPDEAIVFSSPMSEAALKGCHAVQNLGAVQTYIRRYLWVAAMEIVEHDALDASAGADEKPVAKKPAFNIEQHMKAIAAAADMESLKKAYMAAVKAANNDKDAIESLVFAKDLRKGELENAPV